MAPIYLELQFYTKEILNPLQRLEVRFIIYFNIGRGL